MKKLYYLDDSEKNRILEMHSNATKNQYLLNESAGTEQDPYKDNDLSGDVQTFVDTLDFYVTESGLVKIRDIAARLINQWYLDDTNLNDKKLINALQALLIQYRADEGDTLFNEIESFTYVGLSPNGVKAKEQLKNLIQQAETVQPKSLGGATAGGCKGWDWNKVQQKYPCTSPDMFFDTKPVCSQYGDYLRANINNNEFIFFIGDGRLYDKNWKDFGYYACKAGKLEKTSGAYTDKTNTDLTPQMESKKREFVRMITEAGWGAVDSSGSGSGSGSGGSSGSRHRRSKGNRQGTGGSSISNVQNKIIELDSTYKPTGSMDQTTINKIMDLLTNGVKPPTPTPTPYEVQSTTSSASSGD